ncbi:ribonuclease Oy-like protein [Leptotrombidium deliense]|uniref:Ribonuclease Oy-like protein n=1 Tax=Leptotrombidium deliense TaxID=299467 RepID=A0A443SBU1_9ACAR|nr:ribonuclease Oy-like protein [Leptotrombidium deliense]
MLKFILVILLFETYLAQKADDVSCPKVAFDYIDLSLNWAPGLCALKKCRPFQSKWSIHGMWPQNQHGRHPESCCKNRYLNENVIRKLYPDLKENWLTLFGNEKRFWQHEWEKHGTCSFATKKLQGQENYFSNTLQLFKTLHVSTWLAKHSITPQPLGPKSSYQLEQIRGAIRTGYGKRVRFACGLLKDNHSNEISILQEIHFCFDKASLVAVDCLRNDDIECGKNNVHYLN